MIGSLGTESLLFFQLPYPICYICTMFAYMPNTVSVSSDVCFVKGPAVLAAVVVATPIVYIHFQVSTVHLYLSLPTIL